MKGLKVLGFKVMSEANFLERMPVFVPFGQHSNKRCLGVFDFFFHYIVHYIKIIRWELYLRLNKLIRIDIYIVNGFCITII